MIYLVTWDKDTFESERRPFKKHTRATGINQKSLRKAGISGDPVKDTFTFKIQLHSSIRKFTFIHESSLCVYEVFQFESLSSFMFTSGWQANMAPRFISVGSELIGVLFGHNKNYL